MIEALSVLKKKHRRREKHRLSPLRASIAYLESVSDTIPTGDLRRKATAGIRRRLRRALRAARRRIRTLRQEVAREPLKPKVKTPVTVDEYKLVASICRESFYEFVVEFWDSVSQEVPVWNWHIEYLCTIVQEMLERVFKGEAKLYDLVVNIPPGTTKSTIFSVMLPAWAWTRMPRFKFIGASYSEKLARDDLSLKTRDIVTSDKYKACFPEIVLRDDQNTKGYFQNTSGGWRYAVGVNGSVTGKHAHWIGIDDPLDPNESYSEADLKAANRWIKETLSNRKVNKAVTPTALIMQRLHQDDPTAQFLRKKNVRWIKLPAEVEDEPIPEELVQKYQKGLLDVNRLPRSVLREAREEGEGYYASQFRQAPAPAEGAMFKIDRFRCEVPPTAFQEVVRAWDKAGTADSTTAAWTVGTKMARDWSDRYWVLDVVRFKKDSAERERIIKNTAETDGYGCKIVVEQEGGSGGKESAENTVKNLAGYRVSIIKVDKSTGGKVERADPWSTQVNAGNAYLPLWVKEGKEWVSWAKEFVEEHKYFPVSRFKDQVDSAALGFSAIRKNKIRVGGWDASDEFKAGTTVGVMSQSHHFGK